ncbi:hypothetical protein GCM10011579_008650 [Streptomyces albiflavescens]|uniref:Uncharacterized protein n=1 Tax=Streptomyces albiflavescens TaxID=1623582 RepID=A0A917XU65_9ACTN|nr:hypothetical protein GCM10011579_008650 [Streptomyces albiflavescens]
MLSVALPPGGIFAQAGAVGCDSFFDRGGEVLQATAAVTALRPVAVNGTPGHCPPAPVRTHPEGHEMLRKELLK